MNTTALRHQPQPDDDAVVTKATIRAASRLGLSNKVLSRVLGVSEATVSRMGTGQFLLGHNDKAFELALMFLRVFRGLDSIVGGDETSARAWMKSSNTALGGEPVRLIQSVSGLVAVVAYLDSRRADV